MSTNEPTTSTLCSLSTYMADSWSSLSKRDLTMDNQQPDLQSCATLSYQLPNFKMNEPGPAAMMNSIFQQNNMVNDESEQSFVVLGKASYESVKETSLASYVELKQKNITSDQLSLLSTMSPSEKENNLKRVLEENIQLKETLRQNNDAIKEQFETIKTWQKEVMSVCDGHKQRFMEAKEVMSSLKRENDILREKMGNHLSGAASNDATLLPKNDLMQLWQVPTRECSINTPCCNLDEGIPTLEFQVENTNIAHQSRQKDSQIQDCDLTISTRKIHESVNPNPKLQEELPKRTCKNDQIEYLKRENDILREKMNNHLSGATPNDATLLPKNDPMQLWQVPTRECSINTPCCNLDEGIPTLEFQGENTNIAHQSCQKDSQIQDCDLTISARKIYESVNPNPKLQEELPKCTCKNDQVEYLKGIIRSLEQQLIQFEETKFSASDVCLETPTTNPQDKNSWVRNVALYREIIDQLRKSFTSQCTRYLLVQDLLKESSDILLIYKNSKIKPNDSITDNDVQIHVQKLNSYREKLVNQQLEVISDKQSVLKALKEFQRILSDFNTITYEVEILKDENSKLLMMQKKLSEETLEELAQLEKNLEQEKKELQDKETSILEDRLNFQVEKKLMLDEKEKIETERRSLILETENLEKTKRHLIGERESLNHQSRLYETEKENLQQEKKSLQTKCECLVDQINNLRKDLDEANATIQQLRARNHKLSDNEEIISVYRIQTEMHMKEFEEMKMAHKNLQDQLQSLASINLQLQTENERLRGDTTLPNPSAESRYCSICSQYIVPGDRHGLGVCQNLLEFD